MVFYGTQDFRRGLTVIANSVSAAQIQADTDVIFYLTGGEVHSTMRALVGFWMVSSLSVIKADIVFSD